MEITLTSSTFILRDKNFHYECFKPAGIIDIFSFTEFEPDIGYVEISTNLGGVLINWDSDLFPDAQFSNALVKSLNLSDKLCVKRGDCMCLEVEGLLMESSMQGNMLKVSVKDKRNSRNRASFVYRDGLFLLQDSTFAPDGVRKWQMLYFLEVNKAFLTGGCRG